MNKWWLVLISLSLCSASLALDEEQKRKQGERWFKAYDADRDGFISRQEYIDVELRKVEKRFHFIDTTRDGYISGGEAKAAKEKIDKMRGMSGGKATNNNEAVE